MDMFKPDYRIFNSKKNFWESDFKPLYGMPKNSIHETEEMLTIIKLARWFLSKESMTHKKLQKLCYYAQAWHCALFDGKPFVDDVFQAWVHGPVCPSLYKEYADYGWTKIPQIYDEFLNISSDEIELLESVYEMYGKFDGDQLENISHNEMPWQNQRVGLEPYQASENVISLEDMRKYYFELYSRDQNE